ncbi:hypothetical protein [Pseudomonas fluorescens]|uniref:Uncharacterized protein n=1 Tax=Pseudomonas fluorescens TaxID=294 RepID=A0A5E7FLM3_PSEFL|nr:hypothetical protein [Pseudomonas fluorescens]VVO40351.1 hypothetical protein PS710_05801 [Pseudomonas fluorescens]
MNGYWLTEHFLRGMQAPDDDGFRFIVGRKFVDVEFEGTLQTTHVDLDQNLGVYRAKVLTERLANGPVVYKNEGRPTWRLTAQVSEEPVVGHDRQTGSGSVPKRPDPFGREQPDPGLAPKRPRTRDKPTHIDPFLYTASARSPDAQGYYEFTSRVRPDESGLRFAFQDRYRNIIQVDPPAGGFGAQPTHLTHWTDQEIWELYGIQGPDIPRFRAQAQARGKPPQWVEPNVADNPVSNLLRDALKWMHPSMPLNERRAFLQSYNLLPSQLSRLQEHMKTELTMPQWAQTHKRQTEDLDNPHRLDQLANDVINELNLKRDARHDWYDPETSMTDELRETLLTKMGYLRNKNNCLYRTDIPALFRGDERTPFELANDNAMLPRYAHKPGATTHKPMSATFSLKEGVIYASATDPEYLRFNTQTNKYPGRSADDTSSDSDASDASDTQSSSSSERSDAGSPVAWDRERHYEPTRAQQTEMFLYALDTRNMEVVPREENHMFNSAARETPPTWFPEDNFEGLISVTRKGLEANRIWLLNSSVTKGANVKDIEELAGISAERIEAATHAGIANKHEYDQLIDKVEAAGKPTLKLSGNKNEFGHDVIWPQASN